jgi:hypothetical protein
MARRLQQGAEAQYEGSGESGVATAEPVAQRVGDEDVAEEGAEVVDARDDALCAGAGLVEELAPAGVNEDGGEDADVVAGDALVGEIRGKGGD